MNDGPVATMNPRKLIPWIAYLIFFAVLNETVFNVSTPTIARQFSLTPAGVSWMMTIFMVLFGVGGVIFGKLADIFSLRALITTGVVIYVAGSILGFALKASYAAVVAARAIQGIGGSALPALVFVVIARYFDVDERGRIFGLITSIVSLAIGFGPVIGGFVSSSLHWSYLFLIPTLLLVALPPVAALLPRERRRSGSVDILGAAVATIAIGSLVVFLNVGGLAYLASFALFIVLFVVRVRTAKDPFIQPSLFANRPFRTGLIFTFCLFAIVIGIIFLIPLMLSGVHSLSTSQIGLILFPGAISSVIFGPVGGRLADRRGSSFVIAAGLSLLVAGIVFMSLALSLSPFVVAAAMLLVYVGFALFQTAIVNAISQTLPPDEMGVGMGLFNLVGILSGAIGTAIVAKALAGGWLDFSLLPYASPSASYEYSNLMLAFALVGVAGGAIYFRSTRGARRVPAPSPKRIDLDSSCAEPSGC